LRDWLRHKFGPYHRFIIGAYLFGSMLDPTRSPRDIDLVLVTVGNAGEPEWQQVRSVRDVIAPLFEAEFGLPLSAMVLTLAEWREIDGVIVGERESLW
jgi:predicted nucleotidyltransferase